MRERKEGKRDFSRMTKKKLYIYICERQIRVKETSM